MAMTITTATTPLSFPALVRQQRRIISTETLQAHLPQADAAVRGIWSDEVIRKFTAQFELQRAEWHESEDYEPIHNSVIAKVIEELSVREVFQDPISETLLPEMEVHLRVLAAALRLYKVNGNSLKQRLYQIVYAGITEISNVFNRNKKRLQEKHRIEAANISFYIKHCQYLLVYIGGSEPISREIQRRALAVADSVAAGFSHQFSQILPNAQAVVRHERTRPSWHNDYVTLEDACWPVFAADIRMREKSKLESSSTAVHIADFTKTAEFVTNFLVDNLKALIARTPKRTTAMRILQRGFGVISESVMQAGPYEEHPHYFQYGILDLVYQLSFRLRVRSRKTCFKGFVKMIRMVLEQSSNCDVQVQLKATDIWNRISQLEAKDTDSYGENDDRQAIQKWISERRQSGGAERYDISET